MAAFRALLVVPFLFALAVPASEGELAFGVASETTLVRTLKNGYTMELDSMVIAMDGEEVPPEILGEMEIQIERADSYVVTDVFESGGQGRPQRLRRTFDELTGREQSHFSSEEGEEDDDSDYESALEGQSVVFTWNEESDEFDAAFAEGSEGDAELLEELDEDMDLRRILPEAAVGEGDSWQVEAAAFVCIIDPGGDLALLDPEDEEQDTDTQDAQLRDNLTGTITATHGGVREVGGVRAAVIQLDIDTETHAEEALAGDELPPGGSGTSRMESSYQLEGELLWDLEHGHALSLELSGETSFTMVQAMSADHGGESFEQTQTMVFAGSATFSMRFERK